MVEIYNAFGPAPGNFGYGHVNGGSIFLKIKQCYEDSNHRRKLGTIGKRVSEHFKENHEVLIAGRTKGDVTVDISDSASIRKMFEQTGKLDAIVCIAGEAKWAEFNQLTEEDYYIGIKSKLMGQVNLVRIGQHHLNKGGSITLSTGVLADNPVPKTASAAMVNGALAQFCSGRCPGN